MQSRYRNLPSLTAGRGIAAFMVAVFHASLVWPGSLSGVASFGWLGVTFFFILSGFVLTWTFADRRPYSEYMIHRIARIYPVHIVCLLISLASYLLFRNPLGGYVGTPIGTVLQFVLAHDFIPGHPQIRQAWNGVSWTLSVEIFFYLFAPFIIRYFDGLKTHVLLNIVLAAYIVHLSIGVIAHKMHADHLFDFMQYHPIAYMPMFAYGIIGAILMRRDVQIRVGVVVKILLFAPVLVYCFRIDDRDSLAMTGLMIPAFLAFILDQARRDCEEGKSVLSHRFFQKIGEISFSLYMVHALLLGALQYAFSEFKVPYHPTLFTAVFLVASLLAAYLMNEIVEEPMRKYLVSRFAPKPRAATA